MAVIDFDGFRKLVDQLGGIEIEVDMDMRYEDQEDGTHINLHKGLQTLDGKQTLDYIRYRKSNEGTAESSDPARNERQQKVLDLLIGKLASPNGLTNLGSLIGVISQSVKTDIPESILKSYVLSFWKLKPNTMQYIHLDGDWESPYLVVKEEDIQEALMALRSQSKITETTGSTMRN